MTIANKSYTPLVTGTTADVDDVNTPFTEVYGWGNEMANQINANESEISNLSGTGVGAKVNLIVKSNADDNNNDIDIDADSLALQDSATGAWDTVLSDVDVTVAIDASGANGLDAGSASADNWYAIWCIYNGSTTAGLLSLSGTAPTLPGGYTKQRRVGWAYYSSTPTDSFIKFRKASGDNWFYFDSTSSDLDHGNISLPVGGGGSTTVTALAPFGDTSILVSVDCVDFQSDALGDGVKIRVSPTADIGPRVHLASMHISKVNQNHYIYGNGVCYIDSSKQFDVSCVDIATGTITGTVDIIVHGWYDNA